MAYEAAAAGLPALLISLNASQAREAEMLENAGAAVHWGNSADRSREELAPQLIRLQNPQRRSEMSRAGQTLLDGLGCRRVALAILDLCSRHARESCE
jgi:spore coat polysaccharide biosynthesis predicted glycosyltransferase SpsG